MAKSLLAQRVDARLREIGKGAVEAAVAVPGLERNYIRDLVEGKKRSISQAKAPLLAQALGWTLAELQGEASKEEAFPKRIRQVPLLDIVTAGRLRSPSSQIPVEDVPLLAFADLGRGEWFALKVDERGDGDSMNLVSPPGSVIIVNKADRELRNGKYYVFAIDGQTTYKMWQEGDPPYLAPYSTNPHHKPIFIKRKKDFEVIGRVKRTIFDL